MPLSSMPLSGHVERTMAGAHRFAEPDAVLAEFVCQEQ